MDVLALGTAGAGSLGEETVAGGCMGPAIWVTLDRNAKAGGITLLLRFLEENKQGHLIGKKKKKEKDIYTTRTPVKAIVSWRKLTSVSDLPGLKHTAQKSPRRHLKRGREHVAGAQTKKTKVLAHEASFPVGCMQRISARGLPPLNTTQELHEKLSQRTTVNVETKPENVQ